MVAEPAYLIARCETARHSIGGDVATRFLVKRTKQRALFQQFSAAIRRACIGHRLHLSTCHRYDAFAKQDVTASTKNPMRRGGSRRLSAKLPELLKKP